MKTFKVCNKCNAKYLLFHLESDCKFAIEKFKVAKSIFEEKAEEYVSESFLNDIGLTKELDKQANFIEQSRWNSVPFLLIALSFIVGSLLMIFTKSEINILFVLSSCLMFLYAVFMNQGGFNLIFKQLIMRDLLERYHIKIKNN
ncbi:MAG: hypothetical protein V1727_00970 [Candidatus Omnitrophota bacterium]